VLERGEVIDALDAAVAAGKVRIAAYSGDNAELEWAVTSRRFGSVQTSVNLFDQRVIDGGLAEAAARGLGVIAKRPVANAPWRFADRPSGDYCEHYWERMQAMHLDPGSFDWQELALRFAAFLPGVGSVIVGTRSVGHLRRNAELLDRGPLPDDTVAAIRASFAAADDGWMGQV
jgi:aryl-alcohol dehydrogenase-like predicted oxidoreductase